METEINKFKPINVLDSRDNDLDAALEMLDKELTDENETHKSPVSHGDHDRTTTSKQNCIPTGISLPVQTPPCCPQIMARGYVS